MQQLWKILHHKGDNELEKPDIQYPCIWSYKIIGSDRARITDTIPVVLEDFEYQFSESRQSKTGKFTSFHVSMQVNSEEERNTIFNILKDIPSVKFIF